MTRIVVIVLFLLKSDLYYSRYIQRDYSCIIPDTFREIIVVLFQIHSDGEFFCLLSIHGVKAPAMLV